MNIASVETGRGLRNRKILVVADRAVVQELEEVLAPEGASWRSADSGPSALDLYLEFAPDLILLDVELPRTNGYEVCRAFTWRFGRDAAPVIFIGARRDSESVVEGLDAGGVDYVARPFNSGEVLARLRVHLLGYDRLRQLKEEDMTRIRLLRMAAHDLRNPLVSIRALSNFVRAGTVGHVNTEQRDLLDTVYETSQSTLDLVNELFDVSVMEDGEMRLYAEPTALGPLLEIAVKLNNAIASQKGSHIVIRAEALPERLNIDASKIRQVVNNLLGNAIKFSPPGSTITVDHERAAHHCAILIRDEGPGISESEQGKLFKEFGRTSVRPTAGETSTGLGLSICQKIMRAHGGSVQMENLAGGGAEFRIIFPNAA